MNASPCRYVNGYGHYLRSHAMNCNDRSCEGCQPCTHDNDGHPVRHCQGRRSCCSHLDPGTPLVCPRCIARVRHDLSKIVNGVQLLPDEAETDGVDSEAMTLNGPTADPVAWSLRSTSRLKAGQPVEALDKHHPLAVLTRWARRVPLQLHGMQYMRQTVTVDWAADFLDRTLDRIAQDLSFEWSLFAQEIAACRSHLEDVVNTANRPERGAPCPACATAPALVKRYDLADLTGASDTWRCPTCRASWSEGEYRKWVADDYLAHADVLTASDMHRAHGISPGTLRKWAERGTVAKRGMNQRGQQTYDVQQALNQHRKDEPA